MSLTTRPGLFAQKSNYTVYNLGMSSGSLVNTKGWQETFTILREIKKMCVEKNVRFMIMYAPDKPHTLLPLVKHKLPPEKLHAFMALKQKNLPPLAK